MNSILQQFVESPINICMIVLCTAGTICLWVKANKTKSLQLRQYCSTLWTSVGILGTFVSIYSSLIGMNFSSDDANVIQNLIQNIIPAFSTSIIGIIGAVICTVINRWHIANNDKDTISDFQKNAKECQLNLSSDNPELVLLKIFKSIDDCSESIATKLEEACDKLDTTLIRNKKSNEEITQILINKITSVYEDMNKNSLTTQKTIQEASKEQNIKFQSTVESLSVKFRDTLESIQQSFKEELHGLTTLVEGKIQYMINTNKEILNETLKLQNEKFDFIKTKLIEESNDRNEHLESFITSEDSRMREFVTDQYKTFGSLYETIDKQIAHHIDRETQLFENEIQKTITSFAEQEFTSCSSAIEKCSASLITTSSDVLSQQERVNNEFISALSQKLTKTCDSLLDLVSQIGTNLEQKLLDIQEHETELIKKTVCDNKEDVGLLLEVYKEQISQVSKLLKSDYDKIAAELKDSYISLKQDSIRIAEEYNGNVIEINKDAQAKIVEINGSIVEVQQSINESLKSQAVTIKQVMGAFEEQISQVSKLLKSDYDKIAAELKDSYISLKQDSIRIAEEYNGNVIGFSKDAQAKINEVNSTVIGIQEKICESLKSQADAIKQVMGTFEEQISQVSKLLKSDYDKIAAELKDSYNSMKQDSLKIAEEFNGNVIDIDRNAQSKIIEINTAILEIQQQFKMSIEKHQESAKLAMKYFEEQNEQLRQHILDNNRGLAENIASQIHGAFNISALEDTCDRLNADISNTISTLQATITVISNKLEITSEAVSKSAELYSSAVNKSSEINAYISKTVDLFKLHKNSMDLMQNSLVDIEHRLQDQWRNISANKSQAQDKKVTSQNKK